MGRLLLGNQQIFAIQPLADSLGLHLLKNIMSGCREKGQSSPPGSRGGACWSPSLHVCVQTLEGKCQYLA